MIECNFYNPMIPYIALISWQTETLNKMTNILQLLSKSIFLKKMFVFSYIIYLSLFLQILLAIIAHQFGL